MPACNRRCSVAILLTLVMLLQIFGPAPAALATGAADDIRVLLDGRPLQFDVPPVIVEGRTLVPLRAIFQALGAEVSYDGATRTVSAVKGSTAISLVIGESEARVGDRRVPLAVPAQVVQGRTLVPLRFVAEALGAQVGFDGETRTVTIQADASSATMAPATQPAAAAACGIPVANPTPGQKRQGTAGAQVPASASEAIYLTVSKDGSKWGVVKGLFANATNPALIYTSGGYGLLVWSDWSEQAENLAAAVTWDGGLNWTARSEGIRGWRGEATGFQTVEVKSGCLRLYFQGRPDGSDQQAIYSAVSADGLEWVLEQGMRLQAAGSADPFVLRQGSAWRMYFTHRSGAESHVFSASSADGLTFTVDPGSRATGVDRPAAQIAADGRVRLFAQYADGVQQSYISTDGLAFTGESPSATGGRSTVYLSGIASYHRIGSPSPPKLAAALREPDPNAPQVSCGLPVVSPYKPPARRTNSTRPTSGPYFDRVRQATSPDGVNWTVDNRTLFEHQSVPDVTLTGDGRLLLFSVDFSSYTENLAMAESKDLGKTWSPAKEVKVWGWDGKAVDPDIGEIAPGCFRLTFFGMAANQNPSHGEPHKMYSAVSNDGLNFVLEQGVRVELANTFDPDIVKVGDTWRMYMGYTIGEGPGSNSQTISASSSDGLNYTVDQGYRAQGSIPNAIIMSDGTVTLRTVGQGGIPMWTSSDGLNFTLSGYTYGVNGFDPSVVRLPDGTYFMIFKDFMPR